MKKFEEKTLSTNKIFEGKIIDLQVDEVRLPNGKTSKRELVTHPGAVAIIAITPNNELVLVEQYRKPLELNILEIPAGKIEKNEQPEVTALRELEEETGYTTNELIYLTSFYTSPGFANEIIHIYYTDQLTRLKNPVLGDEDEFVEVHKLLPDEINQAIKNQWIYDAKTIYAIQYLQLKEINNNQSK
ncbi:MAG TPA: NUDIX hydrolase [Pseudogracilibacillus sp.]|nr:NUDIX hydrolase [Pseudogracilibacillus sp.]